MTFVWAHYNIPPKCADKNSDQDKFIAKDMEVVASLRREALNDGLRGTDFALPLQFGPWSSKLVDEDEKLDKSDDPRYEAKRTNVSFQLTAIVVDAIQLQLGRALST